MLKFDTNAAPEETDLIRYFLEALKPSIKAEMESQVDKYEHWKELVKKTVDVKVKTALRPILYIREMDQHYPRRNPPAYITTAKSQRSPMKDLCSDNYKRKSSGPGMGSGLGPLRANTKSSTKSKKQKWSSNKKPDTPASGINTTEAETGQKLKKQKRDD